MRHATIILIAFSLAVAAPPAVRSQEPSAPSASPSPSASPTPSPSVSPAPSKVKVAGRDVAAPKRTRLVPPVYPPEAQAAGQRGIVILELLIDETGRVATADVVRSVPPFDQAALVAAREWEYEVTKVDGKPVPVRLTVPITFALKLPEMTREAGIPELRQGAAPAFPAGEKGPATVLADVTLLPDGTVAEAAIRQGDAAFAEAMLQTLRTWRFASDPDAMPMAFQVRAEFLPGPPARIDLRLSGLRTAERRETGPAPSPAAVPAAPEEAPRATPAAPATAAPATVPTPIASPVAAAPAPVPTTTPTPPASNPPSTGAPAPAPPLVNPPVAPPPRPEGVRPSPVAPTPPPVEVIPGGPVASPGVPGAAGAAPSPAPRENGVSAIRDVALAPGVPDLTRGRRPVSPPLARMSSVSGSVQVQFSVDAAGGTSVQSVAGPDLLKEAARQAVATWAFRRTSPERVYLVAVFSYAGDRAQAEVKRAE